MKSNKGKALIISTLFIVLVLAFGVAMPVQASEIIDDYHSIVEEGTVIDDDLFISGQIVEMNGTVTGDVFAGGEKVYINGEIEGNLFAGGNEVVINGIVHGSTAAGGYAVTVGPDADLQRNLYLSGFSLAVEQGGLVGRSAYLGGYQAVIGGEVQRDLTAGSSAFVLDGTVGGDVLVGVERIQQDQLSPNFIMDFMPNTPQVELLDPGITISDNAEIGGELYETFNNVYVPDVRVDVNIPDPGQIGGAGLGFRILSALRERTAEFISLVIVGAVLLYFVRQPVQDVADKMRTETLQSGLWGLVVAFLFPLVVIIGVLTLIILVALLSVVSLFGLTSTAIQLGGLSIGAILAAFSLAAFFVTKIVFGYLVGAAILERTAPDFFAGKWGAFTSLVLGVFLYEVVRALPLLGFIVAVMVILLGLGAIFLWLRDKRQAMLPFAA